MADRTLTWNQGGIEVLAVEDNRAMKFWEASGMTWHGLSQEQVSELQALTVQYLAAIQSVGSAHAEAKGKSKNR